MVVKVCLWTKGFLIKSSYGTVYALLILIRQSAMKIRRLLYNHSFLCTLIFLKFDL